MRVRGFGQIQIALAVAALLALAGLVWAVKSYIDGVDRKGYERGRKEVLLEVASRDNAALVAAQKHVESLRVLVRTKEAQHADAIAMLDMQKTKEVANVEARKERFVADVVAGRIRLFDHGGRHATCPDGAGSATASARAGASVGDAARGCELSREFGAFLGREAGRADRAVKQLQACQQIVEEDRKVCR